MTVAPVLDLILYYVLAEFELAGEPGFCRAGLVGGEAAWDDCCDCGRGNGQLWVRSAGMEPDPAYQLPVDGGCDTPFRLIVGVGALRCVPTIDDQGRAPSAEDESESTRQILADAAIIRTAVDCGWAKDPETDDIAYQWQGWLPLGWEGGCGGGEHLFGLIVGAQSPEYARQPYSEG